MSNNNYLTIKRGGSCTHLFFDDRDEEATKQAVRKMLELVDLNGPARVSIWKDTPHLCTMGIHEVGTAPLLPERNEKK